ncbi:MAG: carbohydrate porin [bacterium]|nr:carbohydrate porin [bacterium]
MSRRGVPARLLLACLLALAGTARADDWRTRATLLGDPGGVRSALEHRGIEVEASTIVEALGNPAGGRRQGFTAVTSNGIDLALDLERLAGARGLSFHLSGAWRTGQSLSGKYIGNVFTVQQEFGNETIRLYALALEQSLWSDRLNVVAGRLGVGDDFATSPLVCLFVSNGICGNPISIPLDDPSFTTYPVSSWGLRARGNPLPSWYAQAGVYEADAALAANDTHGIAFALPDAAGVLVLGEGGWKRPGTAPLGRVAVGLWWDSSDFDDLEADTQGRPFARTGRPARVHAGNRGLYAIAEHTLWQEPGGAAAEGIAAFTMATFAPDDRNRVPFFWDAGIVWRGLVPGRADDVLVVGGMYGTFSDALADTQRIRRAQGRRLDPPQSWEAVVELGYWIQVTGWLQIQPDLQYVARPGGTGAIRNALALGAQVVVTY